MVDAAAFEQAVVACQVALADYQAGLLDGDELRHVLERATVVVDDDGTWTLDITRGTWSHHAPVPSDAVFDGRTIRRWQGALRDLLDTLRQAPEGAT